MYPTDSRTIPGSEPPHQPTSQEWDISRRVNNRRYGGGH